MARIVEIDRFKVKDDDGDFHTVVHYQEYVGPKGEEIKGYQLFKMESGKGVNQDRNDNNLFYLPIGFAEPWVAARRV